MTRPRFNRILLKLSGEALMGSDQFGIDQEAVASLASEVKAARDQGFEMCLVIGGGNIFRGMAGAAKAQGHELCLVVGGGNIFRGMAAAAKGFDRATAEASITLRSSASTRSKPIVS